MIKRMDKVFLFGGTVLNILVSLNKIKLTVMELWNIQMVEDMRVNIRMD